MRYVGVNLHCASCRVCLQKPESMDLMQDFNNKIAEKCLRNDEGVPNGARGSDIVRLVGVNGRHVGSGLLKHKSMDLKAIFIMKISEKCLWNDEGCQCHPYFITVT